MPYEVFFNLQNNRQPSAHKCRISFIHLPLALGRNRVKYNAGFSRTGYAGENPNFSFRYIQRYIFQIVLTKATDNNIVLIAHSTLLN